MDNSRCSMCLSSGAIDLVCGHQQCNSCSQILNEGNIVCCRCNSLLPISNDDVGIRTDRKLCVDCGRYFNSNNEYGEHKRKVSCRLVNYGCSEETDICSMNKHLSDQAHKKALRLGLIETLKSTNDVNLIERLTECVIENKNKINEEITSFDDILVMNFADLSTIYEIEDADKRELTDEQREDLFETQFNRGEQVQNLLCDRINQLDIQKNNISFITEEQTTTSTIQSQFQIDQLVEEESNANELLEQLNQSKLELKEVKEKNKELNHTNQCLAIQIDTYYINSFSIPVSRNGLLIWPIKNIKEEIGESHSRQKYFIDSPKFWSLTGEHPLNARIFLRGDYDSPDFPRYVSTYIKLSSGGKNNLSLPLTCCLVDQTDNHQHILRQENVNLNQDNIGTICRFFQFVEAVDIHKELSRFIKEDSLCLIIKLHEDQSNQYNHYSIPIQNALQQINSLIFQ